MKLKSLLKYNSHLIFPILVATLLSVLDRKLQIINSVDASKINDLANIFVSIIGILLTVLTIYLSFPKSEIVIKRMKDSHHNTIFLRNIGMGMILLLIATMMWIFCPYNDVIIILFCSAMSNVIISAYYVFALSKFS